MTTIKLTSLVKSSGCAAKLAVGKLHQVIDSLPVMSSENLVEGFESCDDALVYKVLGNNAMIQTVDFFPPMVDDPFTFGQIAAANALSDIYAMGASPSVAMNLMCFPSCLDLEVMKAILLGGQSKVAEAGAIIAGGHTISDHEPKYGLCVTGFCPVDQVWSNRGAKEGDAILLTKALGSSIITTASKAGEASGGSLDACVSSMATLNRRARDLGRKFKVHAATDVTGFSLCGHLGEVGSASDVTMRIQSSKLPILEGALDLASQGFLSEGRYSNEDYLKDKVRFSDSIALELRDVCYDPQTSGGLLLFLSPDEAQSYVEAFSSSCCAIIGSVVKKNDVLVEFE